MGWQFGKQKEKRSSLLPDKVRHNLKKESKFHNKPTWRDGWRFDSKKEAEYYDTLKMLKEAGEIVVFLCQVPFRLPGKKKYVCDFLVFWANGTVTFEDVKGYRTENYILKKAIVEEVHHPVKIIEI